MPVVIKSRLAWESLFVQPIAQQMDLGQVKGTLHLCQLISQQYDLVVKTGAVNFPPTGPTPPTPFAAGKTPLFQSSFFIGMKASEVLNLVTTPPLVLAEKALAKAVKNNQDKIDKFNEKKEKLEPDIKRAKLLAEKLKGLKDVYDKTKALDFRGAIDAGAKEYSSPLIKGFDKLKVKADKLTEPELKKEINKKIEKEKQKVIKKLEPLKLKIEKKLEEIENKIKDLINRAAAKISQKITEAQIRKGKLAADTSKAATMSYISTVEANIAAAKAKIAAAKAQVEKIMIIVGNVAKIVAFLKTLEAFTKKLKQFAESAPELKELLQPPKPQMPGGNILGFGKMNLDIRSKEFELPELPDPPDVKALVTELKEKGVDAIKKNPKLKRKTAKLEEKIDKKKKKIEQKLEKVIKKAEKIKKEAEEFVDKQKEKAKQWAINLLLKIIPPGGKDPTAKIKILNEKKKKLQELMDKVEKIKKEVEENVAKVIKEIQKITARIQAVLAVADLIKQGGLENYKKAIDEGAKEFESPLIPGFDKLKKQKDKLTEEELKKELEKKIEKLKKKQEPKIKKLEKKVERTKKRIEEKMKPIQERIERYTAFITAIAAPPASAEVTPSGKLISAALSVGLIGYWTGGTISLPGGMVLFPGLPLNALTTLDGENAAESVSKIFNKDSELDNADKMRTLANVFEAHFKTITGTWMMPVPPGAPVPTPWISYG